MSEDVYFEVSFELQIIQNIFSSLDACLYFMPNNTLYKIIKKERNEANDLADTRNQKVRLFEVQIVENLFGTTQVISVIMEK